MNRPVNMTTKRFCAVIATVVTIFSGVVSCIKPDENIDDLHKNESMSFKLSSVSDVVTKSGEPSESMPIGEFDLGEDFFVEAFESDFDYLPFTVAAETKGSVATTKTVEEAGKFIINAWLGSDHRYPNNIGASYEGDANDYHFIKNESVCYSSGSGWDTANKYNWRRSVPTTFWSYYPETLSKGTRSITWPGNKASDADQGKLAFSYTIPSGSAGKDDAKNQQDLLFAYNKQAWDGSGSRDIDIEFRHALAAVRFDIGGTVENDVIITEIGLKGVAASGECDVTGNSDGKSAAFNWTPGSATADCVQGFTADDFKEKSLDGKTEDALQSLDNGKIFFLIPQEIKGKTVKLCISYKRSDGKTYSAESPLAHNTPWTAGKIYTYKINVRPDHIDVEVEESFSDNVKTNVSFKNTGNVATYIRAKFVGNWYDDSGNIVALWDETQGSFENLCPSGWAKPDEFYYCTTAVEAGKSTPSKLFTKYTAPAAPVEGAHLEMLIITQAVTAKDGETYSQAFNK